MYIFKPVYLQVYRYLLFKGLVVEFTPSSVETVNDKLKPEQRLLAYNLTMAVLGYTDGQANSVLKHVNSCLAFIKTREPVTYQKIVDLSEGYYAVGI